MKYIFSLLLIIALVLGGGLLGASSMPAWYDATRSDSYHAVDDITQFIEKQDKHKFFEKKLADFLQGQVTLNEPELNALLYTKLRQERDGRRLLAVADGVRAQIRENGIELGAVLNLDKLQQLDEETRRKVTKYLEKLPVLKGRKVYLAISGKPVARNGKLAIANDIVFRIGSIPIPSDVIESLGVRLDKLREESIGVRNIRITDVRTENKRIIASVNPDL